MLDPVLCSQTDLFLATFMAPRSFFDTLSEFALKRSEMSYAVVSSKVRTCTFGELKWRSTVWFSLWMVEIGRITRLAKASLFITTGTRKLERDLDKRVWGEFETLHVVMRMCFVFLLFSRLQSILICAWLCIRWSSKKTLNLDYQDGNLEVFQTRMLEMTSAN